MARKAGQSLSGVVLRAARVMADLSQADLARSAGVHAKTVAYWERRGSRGRWEEIGFKRIVDALRVHGVIIDGDGAGVRIASQKDAVQQQPKDAQMVARW